MENKELNIEHIVSKLPDNPNVMGREKYFNSAVLVPLVLKDSKYHFLFQKRAHSIRQGSEICFPGGGFDKDLDESYQDTAIRETVEELGIEKENIKILGNLDTLVAHMGAIVDPFIGILEIENIEALNFNKDEVESVFIIPLDYFIKKQPEKYFVRVEIQPSYTDKSGNEIILLPVEELGLPERYKKPWGSNNHKLHLYKTDYGPIWGITAEIIFELIKLVISK